MGEQSYVLVRGCGFTQAPVSLAKEKDTEQPKIVVCTVVPAADKEAQA